jgi:hypothetical protein
MKAFEEVAATAGVYEKLARAGFPEGAALLCDRCGKSSLLTTQECAVCLRSGWPKCCDQHMNVFVPPTFRRLN